MIDDFCELIAQIEADPEALVTGLTIRDYLMLRQHIVLCQKCSDSADRVNERYKHEKPSIKDYLSEN